MNVLEFVATESKSARVCESSAIHEHKTREETLEAKSRKRMSGRPTLFLHRLLGYYSRFKKIYVDFMGVPDIVDI